MVLMPFYRQENCLLEENYKKFKNMKEGDIDK